MAEKQWRPPDWEKIKVDLEGNFMDITTMDEIDIGIEAVADAMREAIVQWAESIQDDEWLREHPTMGMCLSLDCWEALGGGERARSNFTYKKSACRNRLEERNNG